MSSKFKKHECGLHLVDDARPSYGGRRGHASGAACEVAKFRAWKPREIARLSAGARVIDHSGDLALAAAEIIGADLMVHEHMLLVGVDERNRIVAVADGSSHERDLCAFRLIDALAALFSEGGGSKVAATFMAHNHPRGTPHPSEDDVRSTKNVVCRFRAAPLLDHVIVWMDGHGKIGHYTMGEDQPRVFVAPSC